jgi:hypothetical protein
MGIFISHVVSLIIKKLQFGALMAKNYTYFPKEAAMHF